MQTTTRSACDSRTAATPLVEKLLNIFVSPGEVFEEIVSSPTTLARWLAPLLFVCFTGVISLLVTPTGEPGAGEVRQAEFVEPGAIASSGVGKPFYLALSTLTVVTSALVGTFGSATVLWLIGRVFLKTRFSYFTTLEVVAFTGMILGLGTIMTALLGVATGDALARPALSLLAGQSNAGTRLHAALGAVNFFHLWTAAVLATGLSKLASVSYSEAAFWVFGYWIGLRIALVALS